MFDTLVKLIDGAKTIGYWHGTVYETFGPLIGTIPIWVRTYTLNERVQLKREGSASVWRVYVDGERIELLYKGFEIIEEKLEQRLKGQKINKLEELKRMAE